MINKIKTNLYETIHNSVNSFKEFKISPISKIKKEKINNKIKSDFNLVYLEQHLYSIISNDSSETNGKSNYEKINKIIEEYNKNKENHSLLINFLSLTVQEFLDIFRYEKISPNFKVEFKLVDYLFKEYKKYKENLKNNDIDRSKDYIASLLLLTYNFEKFFYIRNENGREFRKKKLNI